MLGKGKINFGQCFIRKYAKRPRTESRARTGNLSNNRRARSRWIQFVPVFQGARAELERTICIDFPHLWVVAVRLRVATKDRKHARASDLLPAIRQQVVLGL